MADDVIRWNDDDEFEYWIQCLVPALMAAAPQHVAGAFVGMLRGSESDPDHPASLHPDELRAVRDDTPLLVEALKEIAGWEPRVPYWSYAAFVRARLRHGGAAAGHSPYLLELRPPRRRRPLGPAGAQKLEEFATAFRQWCEANAFTCEADLLRSDPSLRWIGAGNAGTVACRDLCSLIETGATTTAVIETLVACGGDTRTALFILRDGIAPPLVDGML